MTAAPKAPGAVERQRRQALSHHEQMVDAQASCAPCALCGGSAVIADAGPGHGYYIHCDKAGWSYRSKCTQSGLRLSGWAYNVSEMWNRMNTRTPDAAAIRAAALEEAVKVADDMWGEGPDGHYDNGATSDGFNIATQRIAAAIRALINTTQEQGHE